MVKRLSRPAAVLLVLPLLAACAETSFMEAFDAGKNTPDERLVSTNQPLSMPPDMALRQPGAASAPGASNGLQVQQGQRGTGTYQAPPPPQPAYQPPQPSPQQPAWQNAQPQTAPQPQPQQQALAPQPGGDPKDKIYYDNGVNPYNADGSRKTVDQLNAELRNKSLENKRAANPGYGTIFNLGELWSGN